MLIRLPISKSFSELVKTKAADESVANSDTLQDDDDLIFPIGPNQTWVARWSIYATFLATGGAKVALAVPAGGASLFIARMQVDVDSFAAIASGEGSAVNLTGNGSDAFGFIELDATIVNGSTAGNVKLQWAQSTSDATATVFKAKSSMVARKK